MRYFIDSEFVDDGHTIDLISIGIVCEDGREYYAQSSEFSFHNASTWVWKNVYPHLSVCPYTAYPLTDLVVQRQDHSKMGKCTPEFHLGKLGQDYTTEQIKTGRWQDCPWRTRKQLCDEVQAFITDPTELWGWCGAYDFVALCQLFGTMMDLPQSWPHYIRDIQFLLDVESIDDSDLPQQEGTAHNALEDARHIKRLWEFLQ